MQEQTDQGTIRSIIEDAADLLLKCAGYLDDLDAANNNANRCETYYAIDADVVSLYLQPKRSEHYAQIFRAAKEPVNVTSLALMLGEFLVASDEPLIPGQERQKYRFLIIPPHHEELLTILTAIHRDILHAESLIRQEARDSLSRIFREFDRSHDEIALEAALLSCTPDWVGL